MLGQHRLGLGAAALSLAAGLIHLVAAPEHLQEWWGYGYFFIGAGVAQLLYAQLLFREPRRPRAFYTVGLGATVAIIALYVVTRTIGIPFFGPAAGEVEAVSPLDVLSKLVELALVVVLAILVFAPRSEGLASPVSTSASSTSLPGSDDRRRSPAFARRHLVVAGTAAVIGLVGLATARVAGTREKVAAAPPRQSLVDPPDLAAQTPTRSASDATGIVEVALTAEEVDWELAPGRRVRALSYNGQVPGPTIRVREGQRVRVTLTNNLSVPTTIHWHGLDVPNAMDGVPDLTQPAVAPGRTFVYDFAAKPAGTRWYHTHYAAAEQQDRGLYAPFLIDPTESESQPPDRDYTLVFGAWVTGQAKPVPDASDGGTSGGMMGSGMGGMMGGGMMGGAKDPAYDTFTVNGKAYPATAPLAVREGERVRLRLINASGQRTHWISLEGHRLRVTHADGNALEQPVEVDVVPIAPAERYDVEFTANHPGVWSLHDLAPGQAEAGLRVQIRYVGREGESETPLQADASGLQRWAYPMGRGVNRLAKPTGQTRDYRLNLSGGMMGSDQWTINGKVYPNTAPLPVATGDLVRIQFFNMSMESHPMHLHGHSFRVATIGDQAFAAPLIKDVINLLPMEDAVIEFVADNPGTWILHCHKPMHMEGGMATLVRYEPASSRRA